MRKITQNAVNAFYNYQNFKSGNTKVEATSEVAGRVSRLHLHGNLIAKLMDGELIITNAGWQSNTTKERLNALDNVEIYQKNWAWYLNDQKWDGTPVVVNNDKTWDKV